MKSDSQDPPAVLEGLQRGYRRGGKFVRPAKVVINELHSN
jgi:molecular chaperone GrpE (heat shock protein)